MSTATTEVRRVYEERGRHCIEFLGWHSLEQKARMTAPDYVRSPGDLLLPIYEEGGRKRSVHCQFANKVRMHYGSAHRRIIRNQAGEMLLNTGRHIRDDNEMTDGESFVKEDYTISTDDALAAASERWLQREIGERMERPAQRRLDAKGRTYGSRDAGRTTELYKVSADADDADEDQADGGMNIGRSYISVRSHASFAGFPGLRMQHTILPGATIESATPRAWQSGLYDDFYCEFFLDLSANAAALSASDDDISSRTQTTNSALLDVTVNTDEPIVLDDMADALQEVVDLPIVYSGYLVLIGITDTVISRNGRFESHESDTAKAFELEVDFTGGALPAGGFTPGKNQRPDHLLRR